MHLHFDPVSLLTGARNQTIILHLMNVQTGYHVLNLMQSYISIYSYYELKKLDII